MAADPASGAGAALVGAGYAVPDAVVGNDSIAARLGVEEAWVSRRTGTRVRHVVGPGERLEDLAAEAAARALKAAGIDAGTVDAVLVGTTTADEMSPHTAPLVAADIGAQGAAAIDVSAACVGFLSCLATGTAMIESGRARTVVVVGADVLTPYLDLDDPQSAMLFGDGAGAVVLTAVAGPTRVGPVILRSDGQSRELIRLARDELRIRMDGPAVYRRAVTMMAEVTTELLGRAGLAPGEVDLFVYHQANSRILKAVGAHLGLDEPRVVDLVGRFANTSSASLPIALAVSAEEGRLRGGDRVLLAAFGAGLVWGGTIVTWGPGRGHRGRPG
ncbi:MAG: ketoacyl-ACP synthase III, partial [Actinomycetota bacterium]|nr:ketoacyl-ACP synthase III [Actinomycetota bacterium]